jgi:hypothetical protein
MPAPIVEFMAIVASGIHERPLSSAGRGGMSLVRKRDSNPRLHHYE